MLLAMPWTFLSMETQQRSLATVLQFLSIQLPVQLWWSNHLSKRGSIDMQLACARVACEFHSLAKARQSIEFQCSWAGQALCSHTILIDRSIRSQRLLLRNLHHGDPTSGRSSGATNSLEYQLKTMLQQMWNDCRIIRSVPRSMFAAGSSADAGSSRVEEFEATRNGGTGSDC